MGEFKNKDELVELVKKVQPAGLRELLEGKINRRGYTWNEFRGNSTKILGELAAKGEVVIPDLGLPPEYMQFREVEGGVFPSQRYEHLRQAVRDAWQRFMEARLNSRPSQVVLITEENNLFPNYPKMRLSKRHHLVTAPRFDSLDRVVMLASHAISERLGKAELGDIFVGLDFQGVDYDKRGYKVIHLSDIFRGDMMDRVFPPRLGDDWIGEVKFYSATEDIWTMGAEAIVDNVPSLSEPGESHVVTLDHIPIVHPTRVRRGKVSITPQALRMSYNFTSKDDCKKATLWSFKYGRKIVRVFDRAQRKGDETWLDQHTVFAYKRMMRTARWQAQGYMDPGRNFVVLPMFPEPTMSETKRGFERLYGLKSGQGAVGGVIVEDRIINTENGRQSEHLIRHILPNKLVDFDIALHNLAAFTGDSLKPRTPSIEYSNAK